MYAIRSYYDSDEDTQLVLEQERESRAWGVTAVPTFIVGRKLMVAGAEDPKLLAEAIERVLAMGS